MDLEYCKDIFNNLCKDFKVNTPPIRANNRLRTTLGRVKFYRGRFGPAYDISVEFSSKFYLSSPEEDVRQVVMHEFCHYYLLLTDPDNAGHSPQFRELCSNIGCTNDGSVADSASIFSNAEALKANSGYKYVLKCPTCGRVLGHYKTQCKKVKYPSMYISTCCHATCISEEL